MGRSVWIASADVSDMYAPYFGGLKVEEGGLKLESPSSIPRPDRRIGTIERLSGEMVPVVYS